MKSGKVIQLSTQSNIFHRIAIIQQTRKLKFKEAYCYPLGPALWSIANSSGDMIKTYKSALVAVLEKGATDI